ncbi:MAG: serine hydrolase domain-containing protein [Burkholderiales bacterium]
MRWPGVLAAVLVAVSSFFATARAGQPIDVPALLAEAEALREENAVPAVGLALADQQEVLWSGAFGIADLATGRKADADTLFRIGSITKTFTAAALLMLQEDGRLQLDDPVRRHVPDPPYANPWESTHPITVAQLLEHTSGFQDWTRAEFDLNDPAPLSLDQGLAFQPESRTARWKPGLHSVYSNSNYGVAGLVLERAAGESYESFITRRLFEALDMRSASLLAEDTPFDRLATGYDRDGRTPIPYWHFIQRPAGTINASPHEMAALVQMLLNRGIYRERRVLAAESVERMETPRTSLAARSGLDYGYGLGNYTWYRNGFLFHGHGGDADGYLSHFAYCRELGVGYFVTINAYQPAVLRQLRAIIESRLTRGRAASPPPPPARLDRERLLRYTGRYQSAAWRFAWQTPEEREGQIMTIRLARGGYLVTETASGRRGALIQVSERHFRRGREHGATSAFVEDGGQLYFVEDDSWVKTGELD